MEINQPTNKVEVEEEEEEKVPLVEEMKSIVWVLKIDGFKDDGLEYTSTLTAFGVYEDGFLLTCAHGWGEMSDLTIKCRPVSLDGFSYIAEVVLFKPECDMCLLRVKDFYLGCVAEFAPGDLSYGDPVTLIGHPSQYTVTIALGEVVYPCSAGIVVDFDDRQTCRRFNSSAHLITPPHRIMGHVYHREVFRNNPEPLLFEGSLMARTPIIQASGLVGGIGCSGAPVFDSLGRVVGMLVGSSDGFQICIHVSALSQFVAMGIAVYKRDEKALQAEAESEVEVQPLVKKKRKRGFWRRQRSGAAVGGC